MHQVLCGRRSIDCEANTPNTTVATVSAFEVSRDCVHQLLQHFLHAHFGQSLHAPHSVFDLSFWSFESAFPSLNSTIGSSVWRLSGLETRADQYDPCSGSSCQAAGLSRDRSGSLTRAGSLTRGPAQIQYDCLQQLSGPTPSGSY